MKYRYQSLEVRVSLGATRTVKVELTDSEAVILVLHIGSRDVNASGATDIEGISVVATVFNVAS